MAIHAHAATLLNAAARRAASIWAPDRRQAAAVPHTRRHGKKYRQNDESQRSRLEGVVVGHE